jgi:F-type H+-transporting ATPase subunit beta
VSLEDALDGCERILKDEFKDYPESALYMIGSVDEAKDKFKPTTAVKQTSNLQVEVEQVAEIDEP